jgi:AGZA family xanthine/uracil permease-like MFS transporter
MNRVQDLLIGLLLFISCSYILVLNPSILATAHFPAANVFTATALAAGLGSVFIGWLSRTPAIVAPGMGLNGLIASFCTISQLDWQAVSLLMLIVCLVHALAFVFPGRRRKVLDAIPSHTMEIITTSIGGMILHDAFIVGDIIPKTDNPFTFISSLSTLITWPVPNVTIYLLVGVMIPLVGYKWFRQLAEGEVGKGNANRTMLFDMAAGLVLLLSVPLAIVIAKSWLPANQLRPMAFEANVSLGVIPWREAIDQITTAVTKAPDVTVPWLMIFGFTTMFVLLIDAPGTPYMLLDATKKTGLPPDAIKTRNKKIERGFQVEAIAGIASVFFRGSPAVCYAESNLAKDINAVRGGPAIVCGALFLIVLAFAYIRPTQLHEAFLAVPLVGLSPLLGTIGASIFLTGLAEPKVSGSVKPLSQVQRFLPRLFAFGGAFAGQLSIGIAMGICLEWFIASVTGQQRRGMFNVLAILSFISLVTIILLMRK